jgi:hypothetical protein
VEGQNNIFSTGLYKRNIYKGRKVSCSISLLLAATELSLYDHGTQ